MTMMNAEHIAALVNARPVAGKRIAVGNDLVHLPTFIKSLTPQFIRRSYTPVELAYCTRFDDATLRYASTWAAKEAVYKVIKQADDTTRLWWHDIEIYRPGPQGKPVARVAKFGGAVDISLTITHDGEYVWALAVGVY